MKSRRGNKVNGQGRLIIPTLLLLMVAAPIIYLLGCKAISNSGRTALPQVNETVATIEYEAESQQQLRKHPATQPIPSPAKNPFRVSGLTSSPDSKEYKSAQQWNQ